jgi:hypothetical protein
LQINSFAELAFSDKNHGNRVLLQAINGAQHQVIPAETREIQFHAKSPHRLSDYESFIHIPIPEKIRGSKPKLYLAFILWCAIVTEPVGSRHRLGRSFRVNVRIGYV